MVAGANQQAPPQPLGGPGCFVSGRTRLCPEELPPRVSSWAIWGIYAVRIMVSEGQKVDASVKSPRSAGMGVTYCKYRWLWRFCG